MGIRRASAIALIVVGALMSFFATEVWAGVVLAVLGILVEAVGVGLERRKM